MPFLSSYERGFTYEIIFVNDGSKDNTLEEIKKLSAQKEEIKYISFSRNFGHQMALKAGMDVSTGDAVITMDSDLQHPVHLIADLIRKWQEGYDIVVTKRIDRKQNISLLKKWTSVLFYKIMRWLSDLEIEEGSADFKLYDRKVVDVIKQTQDVHLFLRGLVPWMGFHQYTIEYEPQERLYGETKYSFFRMLNFAINGITGFSIKPLRLAIFAGFLFFIMSVLYMIYALIVKFVLHQAISGWTSLIMSVWLIGGIQLIILGIIGEYIGKMYIQVKNRPLYIIKEKKI